MTTETTGKARRAAEQATKAEEAAEAARLAEEAAAKAREAARLAQIAAEAAAAEVEAEEPEEREAEESEERESEERESEEREAEESEAARSPETSLDDEDASEGSPDGADPAEGDSAPPEAASAPNEDAPEAEVEIDLKKPASGPAEERRSGALRSWALVAVLAGLVVALGGGTTVLALKVREQKATETASRQGVFAASRAAQALSSYDYRSLDSDLKAGAEMTTGRLRGEFEKLAATLKTLAPRERAVSATTVMKAGVVSASPDKVVALVYANRSSQTSADKQQRLPEPLRIRLTMVKTDGKWLASELAVIS